MRVHVISDVHGRAGDLRASAAGADALFCLGDLLLFVDYADEAQGIFAELFGADAAREFVALRTATHAFAQKSKTYAKYFWQDKATDGGFGRWALGETWISHHGNHGSQSTRGIIAKGAEKHPILRGIQDGDIWGPTDVYDVRLPLPGDSKPLVLGQVLEGMHATDRPASGKVNHPMMPVAWIKSYTGTAGKKARVFATTMGASQDLQSEGLRRLLVNAAYWAVGLESQIPPQSNVDLVGDQSLFVRAAIGGVLREAGIAAALTGLMILLFLGSWRSTLIVSISIPLSNGRAFGEAK